MLKNYLLVALRNIKRHKIYSIVNISGLAIGMSAFILVALLLNYENNWDKFHKDGDRIYRVQALVEYKNSTSEITQTPFPIADQLREDYPDIELTTVCREIFGELITADNEKVINEQAGLYIDNEFFKIFNVEFLQGDPSTALSNENSVIITDELAARHFPNENPIGKKIIAGVSGHLLVTAVVKRWGEQSHYRPSYFVAFSELTKRYPDYNFRENWNSWGFRSYVKLKTGVNALSVSKKIRNILDDKIDENNKRLYLRPLYKLHQAARVKDQNDTPLPYYTAISWFILILASINYINLTTAKSAQREKEIGIRKVVGSNRFLLFKQFIGESLIITFFSLLLSFFLAELLLPIFNLYMGRNLSIDYFGNSEFMLILVGIIFLIGLVSGIYPALYLSSFDPIKVIKGFTSFSKKSGSKGMIRKLLVAFQFVISLSIIIMTYYVFNHVHYMKNKDIGFIPDNLVRVAIPNNDNPKQFVDLRTRLLALNNVTDVSISNNSPFFSNDGWEVNWEGGNPDEKVNTSINRVNNSFIETFGIQIIEGRNFSPDFSTDQNSVIVNESFVKQVGWKNPIGKTINDGKFTVIGVIKDFHIYSVHERISPYCMKFHTGELKYSSDIVLNFSGYNNAGTLDNVKNLFKEYFPNSLYQFTYYKNQFNSNHAFMIWEGVQATFGYFTFISIVIALIGIIGLLAFSVEKKTKELGIRKVLGAQLGGLYFIINKDFFIIFFIALIFAVPLGIFVIDIIPGAYKYQMNLIDYIIPILLVAIISVAATAVLSVKAALNNPVNSLKDE